MSEAFSNRYRVRPSWRLLGAALIGLLWGCKAASLVVKYYGTSIESIGGQPGLWAVGIAVTATISIALGILIDWAYWSDEVPRAKSEQLEKVTG